MKDKNAIDLNDLIFKGLSFSLVRNLLDLVAQNSWWVPPQVYERVQTVYPATRRRRSKETRRDVVNGIRLWTNEPAIAAFWMACGKRPQQVRNANICHIYEGSTYNPDHYTNLANLTALPECLESFSEWQPIAGVLKYHSFKLYRYTGPNGTGSIVEPEYHPTRWDHEVVLSSEQLDKVVTELEHQRITRPGYQRRGKRTALSGK